jgi:hypothetical protein
MRSPGFDGLMWSRDGLDTACRVWSPVERSQLPIVHQKLLLFECIPGRFGVPRQFRAGDRMA